MQDRNSLYTPFEHGLQDPNPSPSLYNPESWENFLNFTPTTADFKPSNDNFEEIIFEKPQESPFKMELEFADMPFDKDSDPISFLDDFDPESIAFFNNKGNNKSKIEENNSPMAEFNLSPVIHQGQEKIEEIQSTPSTRDAETNDNEAMMERSQCSNCHSDEDEIDTFSVSTKDSYFNRNFELDGASIATDENIFADQTWDLEGEVNEKLAQFLQKRPIDERKYIEKVKPILLSSLKEMYSKHYISLTDDVVNGVLKELLYSKETMIQDERKVLDEMIEDDMKDVRGSRMDVKVKDEELLSYKRKLKYGFKPKKNKSNLNHLNENYVSNIFQFAKRNYIDDKELQKIGNERNVSALNFRKLMAVKLTDDVMTRKAKARIIGSGRELITNVETWMSEGYFEQCADREKYIWHKEKALRDLALTGQH